MFIALLFLGDTYSNEMDNRLNRIVSASFYSGRVIVRFSMHRLVSYHEDTLPIKELTGLINKFQCDCNAIYVSRTQGTLKRRIKQHTPRCLFSSERKRPRSTKEVQRAIARHILQCTDFHGTAEKHIKILMHGLVKQRLHIK